MQYRHLAAAPLALALILPCALHAQTAIDLKNQTRNVDFSGAASTRPFKTGTVLPATCTTGESFFKSNATSGQNLYGCVATNTWAVMTGSLSSTGVSAGTYGSATSVAQFAVDATGRITSASNVAIQGGGSSLPSVTGQSGRVLGNDGTSAAWQPLTTGDVKDCAPTLSGGVLTTSACSVRNGSLDVSAGACTVSLSGTVTSGTVYGYVAADGTFTLAHNTGSTVVCPGWTIATGVSNFPADSLPLFSATFSSNAWNSNGVTMYRRLLGRDPYAAGDGLTSSNNSATGITTLQIDSSVVPRYFTGSGAPTQNCTQGRDLYLDTAAAALYQCTAANTWAAVGSGGGGGSISPIPARRYMPWGLLWSYNGNNTTTFTANETRWQQFHLPVSMTVTGIGLRQSAGIGTSKGLRFAIANTSGTILYKSVVNTTCGASLLCEADLASSTTLAAGVYFIGITTDSTLFATGQVNMLASETLYCALVNSGTSPILAGTGTSGSGTGSSVDFGAAMGSLTSYVCNVGTNSLIAKFHDLYLY